MCHTQVETVEHIISGCQTLAADKYLNRHNQVAAQLHLDICKHYAIKVDAQHWYQHNPERVLENEKAFKATSKRYQASIISTICNGQPS